VFWLWGVLGFLGAAVVGMLLSELHESSSILARFIVRRAARRLVEPMRSIREEEWLAELEAMPGLHIVRLLWALHTLPAAWRSPSRRPRGARTGWLRLRLSRTGVEVRNESAHAIPSNVHLAPGMEIVGVIDGRLIVGPAKDVTAGRVAFTEEDIANMTDEHPARWYGEPDD
jgi:hypothetical protein